MGNLVKPVTQGDRTDLDRREQYIVARMAHHQNSDRGVLRFNPGYCIQNFVDNTTIAFRLPDPIAKDLRRVLEDEIVFGQLLPDVRLLEDDVAKRYGVSRSPVREVLRLLEQDGLVVRQARRGIWVAPIGREDLDEVYSCRLALEGLAAEQAATARTEADINSLQMIFSEMEHERQGANIRSYFRCNLRFTDLIHAAAHNVTLHRLLGSIGKQAQRYRFLAYSRAPHLMDVSLAGNRDVLKAISHGDAERARQATSALIRRSWQSIGAAIDQDIAAKIPTIPVARTAG
jgi:DNA-binding GntR family transcriptional regulator